MAKQISMVLLLTFKSQFYLFIIPSIIGHNRVLQGYL